MSQSVNLAYIGIDVSKEHLDVYVLEHDKHFQFTQTEQGLSGLVKTVKSFNPALVTMESTGGLENMAASLMASENIPVAIVNPRQIRDFAKASGILAKTDEIDARVIALFAKAIKPNLSPVPDETLNHLKDMVARRRQLVYMLGQEKNRLFAAKGLTAMSINKHIAWLERELDRLDKDINDFIGSSPLYKEKVEISMSMPGCGPILSSSLIAFLPELGKLNNKKIAVMAGLAPLNRDRGKMRGRRFIRGGRKNIRSVLYIVHSAHLEKFSLNYSLFQCRNIVVV